MERVIKEIHELEQIHKKIGIAVQRTLIMKRDQL